MSRAEKLRLLLSAGVCLFVVTACAPPGVARAAKPVLDGPLHAAPFPRDAAAAVTVTDDGCELDDAATGGGEWAPDMDLRGDPDFEPSDLPARVRCWYEELWKVLTAPERAQFFTAKAERADVYTYARDMNTHLSTLLLAFRVTGDLALLDEVGRLTQHMRSTLDDAWVGRYRTADGAVDGYLNWVWDQGHSDTHRGRDVNEIDEMRAHAVLAQVAYALSENADLASPNGVDYEEHADFWLEYLRDHFEAKWRERNDVPWPEFPFLQRPYVHETFEFVRYHHYMYLLTGEEPYAQEAERLSYLVYDNFEQAETPSGPALVTPHGITAMGDVLDYLMPSTYFRYVVSTALDLHFAGVEPWSDDAVMAGLARSVSEFILDGEGDGYGRDIGGGHDRAGIRATDEGEWSRVSSAVYNLSPFALLAAWDPSGEIAEHASAVHVHRGEAEWNVFMPVAGLLDAALGEGTFAAAD